MKRIFIVFTAAIIALSLVIAPTVFAGGDAAAGKALYNNKKKGGCKTCHNITAKKKVGPGLKGIMGRSSEAWMRKWVANPQKVWAENDPVTAEMKKRLKREGKKKTRMKPKGKLSDADIDNLIAYLKTL